MIITTLIAYLVAYAIATGDNANPQPKCARSSSQDSTLGATDWTDLLTLFQSATGPQNIRAIDQIRNTLALYPLIIDSKSFDQLDLVFTDDVIANYSEPLGVLTPLSAVKTALGPGLATVATQHSYGTQIIELTGECEARSLTYATATRSGLGEYGGQILTAYSQYRDQWVLTEKGWRVRWRELSYMGPLIGNGSIFS